MTIKRLPKSLGRTTITALAVTLAAAAAGVPAPAAVTAAEPDRPHLQRAIEDIVGSGFTGVQLRVHDQQGTWAGSAGVRKLGEDTKPHTNGLFRVGSVTKTFTATVALQLVAEGKVGLDAPAVTYLPEFGLDPRITVRMLLQNTSGLFNFTGEYFPDGSVVPGIPSAGKQWVENRFHTYQPQELVRFALSQEPRFEPGTGWGYSNTNFVLARLLIENVTGRSFADELQRRIVRPLGLGGTIAPGTSAEIRGPHAHAYYHYEYAEDQWKTVDISRQNPSWISAGGDMISTTHDLNTFISALMDGKLIPEPLLTQMRTPHPDYGYGLGLFVQDGTTPSPFPLPSCGAAIVTHNGGVQGYAAFMYSTPDGSRAMAASLTYVDDLALSKAVPGYNAMQRLVNEVFCHTP